MRNALLIFLLLNVLAFIYQKWVLEPDVKVAADYIEQDYPELIQAGSPGERVVAVTLPVEDETGLTCIRIGPFADERNAIKVSDSLEKRAAGIERTAEEGQVWSGYWVQLPPRPEYEQAAEERKALVAAGMKDAYVVTGEEGHSVSIGLFRKRASADSVAGQARELGYEILVQDRYQPGINFWLRVVLPDGGSLQAGEFQGSSAQILRTETVPCRGSES